jgi:hypothetical protein
VVSHTALLRVKAVSAFGITKGARLMLSTPPAIISRASPDLMARVAVPMASIARATAGHLDRKAGQQGRHARDVAVVLAGLVGTAVDHVGDGGPIHRMVARHQGADRDRTQVIGTHRTERAA